MKKRPTTTKAKAKPRGKKTVPSVPALTPHSDPDYQDQQERGLLALRPSSVGEKQPAHSRSGQGTISQRIPDPSDDDEPLAPPSRKRARTDVGKVGGSSAPRGGDGDEGDPEDAITPITPPPPKRARPEKVVRRSPRSHSIAPRDVGHDVGEGDVYAGTPQAATPLLMRKRTLEVTPGSRRLVRTPTQPPVQAHPRPRLARDTQGSQSHSPGHTVRSGQEQRNPNAALLAKSAIVESQEAVKDIVRQGIAEVKRLVGKVESGFSQRLDRVEESVNVCTRVIAGMNKAKDSRAKVVAQLAPLSNIYSGSFYSRLFGMQFISTVMKIVKEHGADEDGDGDEVLEAVEGLLHGLIFRRLQSEKSVEALAKSDAHLRACRFRRDLSVAMITTAQNNESIGVEEVMTAEGVSKIPRPRWLRKGYVKKSLIEEVLAKVDGTASKGYVSRTGARRAKVGDGVGGSMYDEAMEREILGEEIVRRLNQRHVQHLNKSREYVRNEFFTCLGFLWHQDVDPHFVSSRAAASTIDVTEVPLAEVWKPGEETTICANNLANWRDLLDAHREDMSVTVEYDVEVFADKGFLGTGVKKTIRRRLNILLVSLLFCQRFAYSFKADDFFALHSFAMKAVYIIACVFREMVDLRQKGTSTLFDSDLEGDDVGGRSMETLILDLVPPFHKSRTSLLYQKVLRLTEEEFNQLNEDEGDEDEGHGSDMFMSGGEGDEESDDDGDDEILAMQNVNFRG